MFRTNLSQAKIPWEFPSTSNAISPGLTSEPSSMNLLKVKSPYIENTNSAISTPAKTPESFTISFALF